MMGTGGLNPMGAMGGSAMPGAPAPRFTDAFGTGLGTYNLQFKTPAERTDYYLNLYNPARRDLTSGHSQYGQMNPTQQDNFKARMDAADARIKTQYAAQINSPTYNRTGQIVSQNTPPAAASATTVSGAAPVGAGGTAPAAGGTPKNNKGGGSGPMAAQNDTQLLGKNTLLGS